MKKVLALILALVMALGLVACGNETDDTTDTDGVRIFTDDAGREVEVPAEITKIVPSSAMAQMILFAIAPDMLVGLASDWDNGEVGIIDEKYLDLPNFGSLSSSADLNVEELALTGAQVIVDIGEVKNSVIDELDSLQNKLEIPSVFVSFTLETAPETFRTLGKLLGREEKGEQLAQFCERVYARTEGIMAEVGENRVRTLYILGEKGHNVLAKGSYHAELLDMLTDNLAVVENPMSKGTGNEVTMEQIAIWNPDFILFAPQSVYDKVGTDSTWSEISAVKNGSFVEVPDVPLNWMGMPPSAQRYLALIWLPYVLYPEYCDYDVKTEITEFYRLFYGCELTEAQYGDICARAFLK